MKRRSLSLPVAAALLLACGTPGRPTGLPPPEYEQPHLTPWPPPSASAAPAAAASVEAVPSAAVAAPPAPSSAPENTGGSGATLPAGNP